LRIEALIDGRSRLSLQGDAAQWTHLDYAAPGLFEGQNEPTILNGVEWTPVWPNTGDPERRFCECDSDVFVGLDPRLPTDEIQVGLNSISAREAVRVIEQPSSANSYTLIVEFDDFMTSGEAWYVIEVLWPAPAGEPG
jgi:hypothetical protein